MCIKGQTTTNVNIEAIKKRLKNIKNEKIISNKSNFKRKWY